MDEKRYSMDDLCELTGYTRRTIRYYIQEGLLDPPAGRGRGGFYYDSHLDRLREIRSLKETGLELSAIQEVLKKGPASKPPTARELWARYPLVPGLEIQVSRDLEERERRKIEEIIRVAKSILET